MTPDALYQRYQELQAYVGWSADDAARVASLAVLMTPVLPGLIDDFYAEIQRHPAALQVITGGPAQIARLRGTLLDWLRELFSGRYDLDHVHRRWRVGCRHVEIGLDQVYTNVALSRLRSGLVGELHQRWDGSPEALQPALRSLHLLLDLDLAIIEDAYQSEYHARQQRIERLAAIGQVAGGVAHELRNPLNVIKTSVYYLLNAPNLTPAKKEEHLARVERHVAVADNVITALSNFARLPIPTRSPFAIRDCLEEVVSTTTVPGNVAVGFDCPDRVPDALADPDQIRIVLGNLVRNACEAMPEGGNLTLAVRPRDHLLDVSVRDTGMGIPADRLHRIFEPLYSTKARGLGLGLAIARAILEKNQGELRIASESGKGSTFTVILATANGVATTKKDDP